MKQFNTTATCIPSKHYMVDLSETVAEIKKLVDEGKYFTINRARQYGKTTTINALSSVLAKDFYVVFIDFQEYGEDTFEDSDAFCRDFSSDFCSILSGQCNKDDKELAVEISSLEHSVQDSGKKMRLFTMFRALKRIWDTTDRRIVLIIDEVDTAANNQLFLDFLSGLRAHYLKKEKDTNYHTFQSVILAGVTDVKHLKSKIRDDEQHKVNSPWNIAADFDIDMSLSETGIQGMLDEYEEDHHTGMDTVSIAKQIRAYTNGYPYLVSRICQIIDTKLVPAKFDTLKKAWTDYGVDEAVRIILSEDNTFFESVMGKLINYPELNGQLRRILLRGEVIAYVPDDEEQKQLRMYGFICNDHNTIVVSNRIFEMRLYAYYIGTSDRYNDLKQSASEHKSIFVDNDGWLDVPKIMEHFIREHNRIHGEQTEKFLEEEGRERFVTYVSAIINGTGTYSIEEQTRTRKRMDVVIHYLGRRYVIELKIWHGQRYNAEGEQQILDYLDYFGLDTGYLLSFNFNKKKEPGVHRVKVGNRTLFEGIV